jgi:uncharacterized protein (TIGR02001 family)
VKKLLLPLAALAATGPAMAVELTANAGLNSEYIFRGIPQSDGKAAANAGLDVTAGGFYGGTWASTVDDGFSGTDDGLEVDLYGGWGAEIGDFSFSLGATWYTYTDDFDDEYLEANLGGGWKWFSVDIAIGEYDNFTGPTLDYRFYALNAEYEGFYATVGIFDEDFDGEYYEAGYGAPLEAADTYLFDYQISIIHSTDDLLGGDDDTNLVFSITRNFAIFSN